MNNNITCPKCEHEFSLNELQEDLVGKEVEKKLSQEKSRLESELNKEKSRLESELNKEKSRLESEHLKDKDLSIKKAVQLSREGMEEENNKKTKELDMVNKKLSKFEETKNADFQRMMAEKQSKYDKKEELLLQGFNEKNKQDSKKVAELKKTIEKLENQNLSSQQLGEVGENYVLDKLTELFPTDSFKEVKKGESGVDWIMNIHAEEGHAIDSILVESKNTNRFEGVWIKKIQYDMKEKNITTGVIISKNFPAKYQHLDSYVDRGIVICKLDVIKFATPITLLRKQLMSLFKQIHLGKMKNTDIAEKVFEYLNSEQYQSGLRLMGQTLKEHWIIIDKREKKYKGMIKQDRSMIKDITTQLIEQNGFVNSITSEQTLELSLSLHELEEN